MDTTQLGVAGIIITILVGIGVLGKAKVWVFGWYYDEMCKTMQTRLDEKQGIIDELLTVLGKSTETEEMLAKHVIKGRPAGQIAMEGRRSKRSRTNAE